MDARKYDVDLKNIIDLVFSAHEIQNKIFRLNNLNIIFMYETQYRPRPTSLSN